MYFNSYTYLIFFLPLVLIIYFKLNKLKFTMASKAFLVGASLFFYSYWKWQYLALILFSMIFNYSLGTAFASNIAEKRKNQNRIILIIGIVINLAFLGYYKYADFFITNLNHVISSDISLLNLMLPLAISFFTFQQIAYLVDSSKGLTKEYDFLSYCLFVSFFPQLIAGPIVHHGHMMPQFQRARAKVIHWDNIFIGITILIMGLFKKVIIADTLAVQASAGFDFSGTSLSFAEAWCSSLSYTFQIYFDFSGYTDMAVGSALMFNIKLPINFNSPYKALNIQDFWRRWHITLSIWLRDYIYIPLGGSKSGNLKTYRNLLATFILGGLWHGAGWTFIIWGVLHGLATCVHKLFGIAKIRIPKIACWIITFLFLVLTWVFFRAQNLDSAIMVLKAMTGQNGLNSESLAYKVSSGDWINLVILTAIVVFFPNSVQLAKKHKPNTLHLILFSTMFIWVVFNFTKFSEFLYFNF